MRWFPTAASMLSFSYYDVDEHAVRSVTKALLIRPDRLLETTPTE